MENSDTQILSPIEIETFFSQNWEQNHLHIQRQSDTHFAELLSVETLETLLSTQEVWFPDVQVVQSNKNIPIAEFTDENKKIVPKQLIRNYKDGATVIVSQAHRKIPELASLCRQTTKQFNMRCQANVYLSPAGNQGFKSHYDTHDVFILQVSGSKVFRLYKSEYLLPFTEEDYEPALNTHDEIVEEVKLAAGDTLYIPRGLVHDAIAFDSEPSLHVTLGVYPIVVRDLLQSMIQIAAEENVSLRRSVGTAEAQQENYLHSLRSYFELAASDDVIEEALTRMADELAIDSIPLCKSMLSMNGVSVDSTINVVDSSVFNCERKESAVKLRTAGQVLMFDEPMSGAVEYLLNRGTLLVRSLPGLNAEQQLALTEHLLQANAISVG